MQSSSSASMSTAWCAADLGLCTSDESDRSDLPEKEEGDKAEQSNPPNPIPGASPEKEEEGDAAAQSPVCQPVWLSATMGDKKYQRSVRKVQWRLEQCLPQFAGMHNSPLSLRLARRILAALSPTDRALIESNRPASDLVVLTPVLATTFWTRLRDTGQLLPEVLHEFLYPEVASPEPAPAPPPEEDVILCTPPARPDPADMSSPRTSPRFKKHINSRAGELWSRAKGCVRYKRFHEQAMKLKSKGEYPNRTLQSLTGSLIGAGFAQVDVITQQCWWKQAKLRRLAGVKPQ